MVPSDVSAEIADGSRDPVKLYTSRKKKKRMMYASVLWRFLAALPVTTSALFLLTLRGGSNY